MIFSSNFSLIKQYLNPFCSCTHQKHRPSRQACLRSYQTQFVLGITHSQYVYTVKMPHDNVSEKLVQVFCVTSVTSPLWNMIITRTHAIHPWILTLSDPLDSSYCNSIHQSTFHDLMSSFPTIENLSRGRVAWFIMICKLDGWHWTNIWVWNWLGFLFFMECNRVQHPIQKQLH